MSFLHLNRYELLRIISWWLFNSILAYWTFIVYEVGIWITRHHTTIAWKYLEVVCRIDVLFQEPQLVDKKKHSTPIGCLPGPWRKWGRAEPDAAGENRNGSASWRRSTTRPRNRPWLGGEISAVHLESAPRNAFAILIVVVVVVGPWQIGRRKTNERPLTLPS